MTTVPPSLASLIAPKLLAAEPRLQELISLETVDMPGPDLWQMLMAIWMCGYADGLMRDEDDGIISWAEGTT